MNSEDICYWCGLKATSKEHVPPRCLFPEEKDINWYTNNKFRENLITVPSCDKHNLRKSHDDEYLMACLSGLVGNNVIAYIHSQTKVKRAVDRNKKLLKFEKSGKIKIKNKEFPIQWVNVDIYRLMNSFESIGRALYFHEYNSIYKGECQVVSKLFLNAEYKDSYEFIINSIKIAESEQKNWKTEIKGINNKIFTYQFGPIDEFKCQLLELTFYESIKVYIAFAFMTEEEILKCKNAFKIIEALKKAGIKSNVEINIY